MGKKQKKKGKDKDTKTSGPKLLKHIIVQPTMLASPPFLEALAHFYGVVYIDHSMSLEATRLFYPAERTTVIRRTWDSKTPGWGSPVTYMNPGEFFQYVGEGVNWAIVGVNRPDPLVYALDLVDHDQIVEFFKLARVDECCPKWDKLFFAEPKVKKMIAGALKDSVGVNV